MPRRDNLRKDNKNKTVPPKRLAELWWRHQITRNVRGPKQILPNQKWWRTFEKDQQCWTRTKKKHSTQNRVSLPRLKLLYKVLYEARDFRNHADPSHFSTANSRFSVRPQCRGMLGMLFFVRPRWLISRFSDFRLFSVFTLCVVQVLIPAEAAEPFVDVMARENCMQFMDLNEDVQMFQRKYTGDIVKLQEVERLVKMLEVVFPPMTSSNDNWISKRVFFFFFFFFFFAL